jgi:hypothetical protein
MSRGKPRAGQTTEGEGREGGERGKGESDHPGCSADAAPVLLGNYKLIIRVELSEDRRV